MRPRILQDKRIFIVEDDVGNRAVMQTLLENEGAAVAFERWGKTTMERLNAFAPVDIILLDLMISTTVSGYDLFDLIRKYPEYDAVPIVAVSATDPSQAIPKRVYGKAKKRLSA